MIIIASILALLFGMAIGSFLNVVVDRASLREAARGRSWCDFCKKTLSWFELLPVVSFVIQRGKCRSCQQSLSSQYPTVELFTGIAFALTLDRLFQNRFFGFFHEALFSPGFSFASSGEVFFFAASILFAFLVVALLVTILVYDLKHKVIPDEFSYTFATLALLKIFFIFFFFPGAESTDALLLAVLAGPLLALPFALLWLVSRGKWMGLGDAKLTLGIGWLFELLPGFTAIIFAFWSGALVGVLLIAFQKIQKVCGQRALSPASSSLTMKSELPFAPFLILGMALVFFFGINLFSGAFQIFF
ncbi:MAG TPA: prepilin peptidase [Candidatus Paceibacterota bacterium]|nr:prepilin peptidase [Candidatus Paceibacterota bacterium]